MTRSASPWLCQRFYTGWLLSLTTRGLQIRLPEVSCHPPPSQGRGWEPKMLTSPGSQEHPPSTAPRQDVDMLRVLRRLTGVKAEGEEGEES